MPGALIRPPEWNGHCFTLPSKFHADFSHCQPEFRAIQGRNSETLFGSCDTGHGNHSRGPHVV